MRSLWQFKREKVMENEKETLKILIIDDAEIDLDILESILNQLGFQNIIRASSGMEGVQLAEKHRPELVMSDIMMPGIDGGEVRQRLKENPSTEGIPVIFTSSIITKKEEKELGGLLQSGDQLVAKPYSSSEISKAIDFALGPTIGV
jgi:CheY-like chemotaxis protein